MTDESKQLSVAELLARNGQQGAAPSSSGGRRRRGGRGISVAELTGDLPVVPVGRGHSAHAAPEDEPAESAPEPSPFDYSLSNYAASEPVSYNPPEPAPEPAGYSPMSGPITMYDPLRSYAAPEPYAPPPDPQPGYTARVMPGREMPESPARGLPGREMPGATEIPHGRSGRRADPLAPAAYVADPVGDPYVADPLPNGVPPSGGSGRRHRPDPDDATTEVQRLRELDAPPGPAGRRGAPNHDEPKPGSRAARRRAKEAAEEGPSTAAWSPTTDYAADPEPRGRAAGPANPEPPQPDTRRSAKRGPADGGLPAWSARRHKPAAPDERAPEPGGIPTAAWSLASQDQQLISGHTVAGDLLRDGVDRAEAERADRDGRNGRSGRGFDRAESGRDGGKSGRGFGRGKRDDEIDDGHTDVYAPVGMGKRAVDEAEDDIAEADSRPKRLATATRTFATATRTGSRRARSSRQSEEDANRRQWMILGGQSAGAAVAGMLLFKGFERMWEMLPWVALILAMVVILGLVALVRILRRTDDILSTVIAVVVGSFVTLGPLAFLLSTS
ncbi:hypothetical protein [Nocardia arthritidis]|uniref:Uncharacterized protein n=1 Tax=Nocardia arthritidis TaxID=228602 RepID=A0A6G9YRZ8_9NOCA|nr:hypothetical protein [Nocardia arthritidis]QIS16085.1 hypothetical protein F5544_41375 [Nocardia arthritidis]